jgi:hypothetical protein
MFHRVTGTPDVIGRLEGEVDQRVAAKRKRPAIRAGFSGMCVATTAWAEGFAVPVLKLLQRVML